jgi:hypothetical protein
MGRICGNKKRVRYFRGNFVQRARGKKVKEIYLRFIVCQVEGSVSGPKLKAVRGIRGPITSVRCGIFLKKVWRKSNAANQLKILAQLLLLAFLYRLALQTSQV